MSDPSYRSLFDLTGKTALVTGGAGFLGEGFCRGYAEFGAAVAVVDIEGERAQRLAATLARDHGVATLGLACDIADPAAVERMVAEVVEHFGGIDVLHNNAANQSRGLKDQFAPFEDYDAEDWRRVMQVDVEGMFLVARFAGAAMARRGRGGSIIQTSSIYGALAPDHRIYAAAAAGGGQRCSPAVYSAGKAAIIGFTRWLATYWAKDGIRANALVPGGVENGQDAAFRERYGARVPLGRMARRQEVVAAALFLASDASSYVTGQCLFVDGGLSAW